MPQLSDLVQKRKFVKKEYRPWDLSGSGTVDNKESTHSTDNSTLDHAITEKHPIATEQAVINKEQIAESASVEISQNTGNKRDNVLGNKQVTNRKQRGNIEVTKKKYPDNIKITTREQPDNILDNVTGNNEGLAYLIESVKKLTGIQKNIFYYVIHLCSARGALDTGNLLSSDLAKFVNCTIGSAKTSLIRLIEKRLVVRLQGKACRGGHIVLSVTKEIQSAAIQAQQSLFNPLKSGLTDNITDNNTGNAASYSSSNKNNTTTSLPEEWKKINYTLLSHIGFSETQIRQLFDINVSLPEVVQDSINRFAYSLEHNDKAKAYNEPLNVLMGVLRKGQRWNEPNYIDPKELALREMLEEKRRQKERHDAMVKELVELEFPKWRKQLTEDEIKEILPTDVKKTNITAAIEASLRLYFTNQIILPQLGLNEIN